VPAPVPPPIPALDKIDDVIDAIDTVVAWSARASSRLGYFAAMYKRVTIGVRQALRDGQFENGPRLERLDVRFAGRYFDALNGWFHPADFDKPSHAWQVTFDAAGNANPILVQHMLAGVNAHIGLDLGIVAAEISSGTSLLDMQEDFNRINAVLASQASGIVADINELSPALADVFSVLRENEMNLINGAVKTLRDDAWRFALGLDVSPDIFDPFAIGVRDLRIAQQGALIYQGGPFGIAIDAIAARESRNVKKNILALDEIASVPAENSLTL
jgi:uncharacterized protein DUF5995